MNEVWKKYRALIATVLIAFSAALIYVFLSFYRDYRDAVAQQEELKQEIYDKSAENDRLQYELEHSDDDAVIADVAREKLDMVYPDEEVYYEP